RPTIASASRVRRSDRVEYGPNAQGPRWSLRTPREEARSQQWPRRRTNARTRERTRRDDVGWLRSWSRIQVVHRHPPTWQCRFRVGNFPTPEHDRMVRIRGLVDTDDVILIDVHVPNDLRPRGEIIGPLFGHFSLGRSAVVVLATDFDGEDRGSVEELPALE